MRRWYVPAVVPLKTRVKKISIALILTSYGGISAYYGKMVVPGRGYGLILEGIPLYLMLTAFLCGIISQLSVVVSHYDKRNNEGQYEYFSQLTMLVGWGLGISSIAVHICLPYFE
ncbi:hypothetical protein [Vibrio sp. HN007]|uniref:hypothetical protein n=1 Tax=Vibrio iocasae TaxID=3098914 RepID=UPI0035D41175